MGVTTSLGLGSCRPCGLGDDVFQEAASLRGDGAPPAPACSFSSSNTRLLRGAREGDPSLVREALDAGAFTETRSVASSAAKLGSFDSVLGMTALMHAARGGHLTCVMALLDSRAALDAEDEGGATPLHFAASSGDLDVFKALILAGADASATDALQRGPLDYLPEAIRNGPDLQKSWRAVLRNELPYGV
ncbi:unnamed protein product [Polarella glacialis]|uniref:Uncharacterized protein n=1 Tax=Polarella glacialis TaxID=89957 RepID=A0A813L6B4_POLGL|nr:unnamed protein product [Polarella glacialis]CAE8721510.1 unnamed protein product [Polarella glacialis]